MNQNVYAFRLSGSRMRQSASQLKRHGQVLDALALMRRAAEQDDTPAAWQALAVELRQSGNWEAAVQVLARVLSRDTHHPGAWAELARCLQMLGQDAPAMDCAYHQLQEDPWGKDGDVARAILAELDVAAEAKEPRRTQRLIHRGLKAWQAGERTIGERRVQRAVRLTGDKARLLVTAAMMCMLVMDFDGALRYLPRALRHDPQEPRALTALSTLYHRLGKRRIARGMLVKAGLHADNVLTEDGFLTTAWAQDAWDEMQSYLARRMKRMPYRAALLSAQATMYAEMGETSAAQELWKNVLAIDPDDRQSAAMIAQSQQNPEGFFIAPGMLPRNLRSSQMAELRMACESLSTQEVLRVGSRLRRLVDWFIASGDGQERRFVMELLENADPEALIPYLRELLCRPFLRMETRQWALIRLAQMGCTEEMLMMAGSHYTLVACQKVDETKPQQHWRTFCTMLLKESGRYQMGREMIGLAAEIWPMLTPAQRQDAIGAGRVIWARALEILCLRMAGEDEQAAYEAAHAPVSARKISRVLRQIGRVIAMDPVME